MAKTKLAPSSFPMWLECACFESEPRPEVMEPGRRQHELMEHLLLEREPPDSLLAEMKEGEVEAATWAAEATRDIVKEKGAKDFKTELMVTIVDLEYDQVSRGRIDVGFGRCILDYKSGEVRDYRGQMHAYALGWAQTYGLAEVEIYELYGRYRKVKHTVVQRETCETTVFAVKAKVEDPNRKPRACMYCGWCKKRLECPALLVPATLVHDALPEKYTKDPDAVAELVKVEIALATPEQLSLMKRLADILQPWCEGVQDRVKGELAGGADIPGFVCQRRKGNRYIADIVQAYQKLGLPIEAFLGVCSVSLSKVESAVAEAEGLKKKAAGEEVAKRLGDLVRRGRERILVARAEPKE